LSPLPSITSKVRITQTGLDVREVLSYDEWASMAPQLGSAVKSIAFVMGDWLNYGEDHFAPTAEDEPDPSVVPARATTCISRDRYRAAQAATGIDISTLRNYAYVARSVKLSLRNDKLSWDHHRAVAKLAPADQTRWLQLAATSNEKVTTRRLRASITAGQLIPAEAMSVAPAEQAVLNHIPSINRLSGWWAKVGGEGWLASRSTPQIEALLRDFQPVRSILDAMERRLENRRAA
jgi:hypothetical protein